jgi:hypothetical protein
MQIEKKYWIDMLDADSADFRVQQNAYINMEDFRFGPTSDKGFAEQLESVGGTALVQSITLPAGTNYCIGTAQDYPNRRVVYFIWNSNGSHGIYCYFYTANAIYPVLLNSQLTGGLNFSKYNLIHSARVENKNVYWTDNLNEPRRMNIDYGIQMNITSLSNLPPGYQVNTAFLPVTNIDLQSGQNPNWLVFTFQVPQYVVPAWGSGLLVAKMYYTGTAGSAKGPNELPLFINSGAYPTKTAAQIVADGVVQQLSMLSTDTNWGVFAENFALTVHIYNQWDFGTGDTQFAPTVALNIEIQYLVLSNGTLPTPYNAPLSESVISWIRRQPGLPPTQTKILENPVPSVNFIADQAFQFAYRYSYTDSELSTLSALSTTADFNEADPPPEQTSLNIPNSSVTTGGYLATNILLPPAPTPGYGPAVQCYITRVGTAGPNAVATDIPVTLNWNGYPGTRSYTRVIVEGLNQYFLNLPGNGSNGILSAGNLPASIPGNGKWFINYRDGVHPTLNILETWDWGLGDNLFPPTVEANVQLYTSTPAASKQFNRIDIQIPLAEAINQDVAQVDLVANYLITGVYFIIKSWRKALEADAEAIANHNLGITALAYSFYNNQAGIALDSTYASRPFDSVPLLCQTIEMAINRGFMANYLAGYTSANLVTSLTVTPLITVIGSPLGTAINGEWYLIQFFNAARTIVYHEYILETNQSVLQNEPPSPQFYYTIAGAVQPFPASISTGLIYLGTSLTSVMNYYIEQNDDQGPPIFGSLIDQDQSSALLIENPTLNFGVQSKAFKANSSYQAGIVFYDYAGRKCGVITNSSLLVNIPNTAFSANQFATGLTWTLSNAYPLIEIPSWAYYYSISLTKCLRTRSFVESIGFVIYASKDAENNYTFDTTVYSTDLAGVAVDLSFLSSDGLGYVFAKGDIINFFLNGAYYSLGIIGQSAQYVIGLLANVGALTGNTLAQYEIYTPYQQSATEPYFELGQFFPIANPGTNSRSYSLTSGTLAGDIFVFKVENFNLTFYPESMTPNFKYYQFWFTDAGRSTTIDYIGQVQRYSSVTWSDTFIYGSADNGLSTFEALDQLDLAPELGPINKLQLCSKVSKIGTVMLAIGGGGSTASIYLSENTLISNTGDAVVAQANTVIGSVHDLKGDFGTLNPESVIELRGNVYWYDAQNGKIIQYADNGLFPISNYKMSRYWKLFSDQYKSMTPAQIEALGGRPFVFGAADPHHGELLWTVPQLLATPPRGYLPDYPSIPYPFDIYDGRAKTLVYKLYTDPNHWQGSYSFTPEYAFYLENNLFSFKNGQLYLHNQSNYCNYYSVQYSPAVMFISNQELNMPKSYNNFSAEANQVPAFIYMLTQYPYLQATDLYPTDFTTLEGIFYAPMYRNKLDPAFGSNYPLALTGGEKMRGTALYVMAQWSAAAGIVQVKFCNLGFTLSVGQKVKAPM